jgi:hypothetical protein
MRRRCPDCGGFVVSVTPCKKCANGKPQKALSIRQLAKEYPLYCLAPSMWIMRCSRDLSIEYPSSCGPVSHAIEYRAKLFGYTVDEWREGLKAKGTYPRTYVKNAHGEAFEARRKLGG